jgi:cytochrome P450
MATVPLRLEPAQSNSSKARRYPPGPTLIGRIFNGRIFRQSAIDYMQVCAEEYGDLVHYMAASRHIYQLNHPELISDYFLKDAAKHHRGVVMQRAKIVLGEGLLTSEEPLHMRQRRLAQPAFHRKRIAAYGEVIGSYAERMTGQWQSGATVDLHGQMLELALLIVGKCLFDVDVKSDVKKVETAVNAFMSFLPLALLPFSEQLQKLPLPAMRRIRAGQAELDALIYRMIRERRATPGDRGDLLSMLLESVDTEGEQSAGVAAGGTMSDQQVHDECTTVLLAGHETTANALSFALWLLGQHPEIQERLHTESAAVLGGRTPVADDYPRLRYAEMVFAEAMRLYPPVWVTARTCAVPYEIAGYRIPAGAILLAPQICVHRDARFYDDPLRFDPERFSTENKAGRPRFAYFPFAAGSRQCIAEGLAWMEGVLVLATIAQNWKLRPTADAEKEIAVQPAISLRPKAGVPMTVERR